MIKGITISEGTGIGRILNIKYDDVSLELNHTEKINILEEKSKLKNAISQFVNETEEIIDAMTKEKMQKESEILKAHIAFFKDIYVYKQMSSLIDEGKNAKEAVCEFFDEFYEMFRESDDDVMKNRAEDFGDMKSRLMGILSGKAYRKLKSYESADYKPIILVDEIRPSFAAELDKEKVAGVISRHGGYTSHSAIMMRAKDIPAVFGANVSEDVGDDILAVVDGTKGLVFIDPPSDILLEYEKKAEKEKQFDSTKKYYKETYTLTACGNPRTILANISDLHQAKEALNLGAGGIGLYRTEYLYMGDKLPTEEEQVRVYEGLSKMYSGMDVVIRTLDAGADKECKVLAMEKENNPFLGERGIRYCLNHLEIFKIQIRSLLRASRLGNIKVCLPMVSSINEVRRTKEIIDECIYELSEEQLEFSDDLKLGIMLETPASCIMAREFADEVDFFSLGTNDLTGYVMAADRGNYTISDLSSMYNPAVIRLMVYACSAIHEKNKEISICGEDASDIKLLPLLLAAGVDKLSVGGESIWRVRREIAKWNLCDASAVLENVLKMATKEEVEDYLSEIFIGGKQNGNQNRN